MKAIPASRHQLTPQTEERIRKLASRYHSQPQQLMRILLDIQEAAGNAFPRQVATIVCEETGIPEAKLYSYISFYARLSPEPRGQFVVRMCKSAPCHVCGAVQVMEAITRTLGIQPGETTRDGQFTLEYCQCLGVCESAPAIMVNDQVYTNLTPGRAATLMEDYQRGDVQ